MATATFASISAELEAIDEKKAELRKAFEDLQSHSSLLSPSSSSPSPSSSLGNLKWDDIDSYFTSLQSNLHQKFALLKALKSDQPKAQPVIRPKERDNLAAPDPVPARPELKSLCEKMDGLGLRNYLLDHPKERAAIRAELADAWKHAPDPAKLVVDAVQGDSDPGRRSRRVAVVLLEELMMAKVEVGAEVKEKVMAIAVEWKGKLAASAGHRGEGEDEGEEDALEKLCFLHLLAAFGLVESGVFDMNELVEYAVVIARYRQAVELCSAIGFGDKICDIIQKLIGKSKQLLAVKFIFHFEMTDKFPPVPLLKAYVLDTKKLAQKIRKNGKHSRQSLNEAAAKEINSLRSVIKIVEDHGLESQYPKEFLLTRIEKLEKEKTGKKRIAAVPGVKSQPPLKQQKQSVGKPTKVGAAGAAAFPKNVTANSTVPAIQQPHAQMAGLLAGPYLSTPAAAYGLAGSAPAVTPYVDTSADMYGLSRTHMSFSGNLDPSVASLYPSESLIRPSYYDRSVVYSGYGYPPQYHPTYYPQ